MEERPQPTRAVVEGRSIPTLPGLLVVALLAGSAGLFVGWELAGGTRGSPTPTVRPTTAPTVAPLVEQAAIDQALRRAYIAAEPDGDWLLCEKTGDLGCRTVRPIRLSPADAFGAPGGLWPSLTPVRLTAGGRFALVADLTYAVGSAFYLAPAVGTMTEAVQVTEDGGIHYVDLGVLAPGRYAVVAEAELGPPAGGLVEAIGLDIAAP